MSSISLIDAGVGVYAYGCALRDWCTLPSSLGVLSAASVVATTSYALLWSHSVCLISLGSRVNLIEKVCFSAFTLFYGMQTYRDALATRTLAVMGHEVLTLWSVLEFLKVTVQLSVPSAVSLALLGVGMGALAINRWCLQESCKKI